MEFYNDSITRTNYDNLVAIESVDPGPLYFSTPDTFCTSAHGGCRYSDAAFATYVDSSYGQKGRLARTTGLGDNTVDLGGSPYFLVSGGGAADHGDTVYMMGAFSGWQQGTIHADAQSTGNSSTCIDLLDFSVNHENTPIDLICQTEATYSSQVGDSGAPIFMWDGSSSHVTIVGIHVAHWGSWAIFSPWTYVSLELGDYMDLDIGN
ncbi:MAG TPA: hypothetical protein VGI83_04440 [Gemmatimonadales bacterium]|jgi:hypothetical protein